MGDASHTFESYYKRATSPLIVLQLLKDQVMYGYQISQAMQNKAMADIPSLYFIRSCIGWRNRAISGWIIRR